MSELKPIQLPLSDEERYRVMTQTPDILERRHGKRPHPSEADDHARLHFWTCLLAEEEQGGVQGAQA